MSFFGLEIALNGLRAQQQAMDVTAHNIANAGTEGYHRQEAVIVPRLPIVTGAAISGTGSLALGSGAAVDMIRRLRSEYVDHQIRSAEQRLGATSYAEQQLSQVESVLAEPGELGMSSSLDRFWNAWEELTSSPESQSARISVVETGSALSERIRSLYSDLTSMQTRADQDVADNVEQINRLAQEIADISKQARRSIASGNQPNDLLDRRDVLIGQLSQILKIQVSGEDTSDLIIAISGVPLVQGDLVTKIDVTLDALGRSQLIWSTNSSPVKVTGGQLAGQLQIRDQVLQSYIDSLNDIARSLIDQVNQFHIQGVLPGGFPAGDFFVAGADASNIAVEAALVADPALVASSASGNPGDNGLARAIAGLRNPAPGGGETINQTYQRLVARIGAQAREAISAGETYRATLEQLKTQRESVSGVSLDEEMLNMARFQQAYNAAARMATVMDEMIDTIVSRTGVVGR